MCENNDGFGIRLFCHFTGTEANGIGKIGPAELPRGITPEKIISFFRRINDLLHAPDHLYRVFSDRSFSAQHQGICSVQHCIPNIIGFSPGRLFRLVMWESLWLAVVGVVVGAAITSVPYYLGNTRGIDMSAMVGGAGKKAEVAAIKAKKPDAEVTFKSRKEGYGSDYRKILSEARRVLDDIKKYVPVYDAKRGAVRVRCLLGNDLEFTWDEFVRAWCIHHPMAEYRDEIVYTMCVVGECVQDVEPWEAVLSGLRSGVELLGLGEFARKNAVCGIPAYDMLLRDLEQADVTVGEECCTWLGLGLMHHHGSRWAIRDFLSEARGILPVGGREIDTALATYGTVLTDLRAVIELLPSSMAGEDEEAEEARERFLANRHLAAKHLRSARSAEETARDALKAVLDAAN